MGSWKEISSNPRVEAVVIFRRAHGFLRCRSQKEPRWRRLMVWCGGGTGLPRVGGIGGRGGNVTVTCQEKVTAPAVNVCFIILNLFASLFVVLVVLSCWTRFPATYLCTSFPGVDGHLTFLNQRRPFSSLLWLAIPTVEVNSGGGHLEWLLFYLPSFLTLFSVTVL